MAVEAREAGRGGITMVARATGAARSTVTRCVDELESGATDSGRIRRSGAGRKRAEAVDPELAAALERLVDADTRGDPESPLRWTIKSTRQLSTALTGQGHRCSEWLVRRLLHDAGYSLQAAAKQIEGTQHPDRDAQFRYVNDQVREHHSAGQPVISVDTKKKELVGQYKNGGTQWRPSGNPQRVRTHDFPDKDLGKAIPYGVYDIAADAGWVSVGADHDTAAFAVATIRRWWQAIGVDRYPHADKLLITADAGESNGYRTRLWKTELAALATETGLAITVCHFPPGTSNWNKSALAGRLRGSPGTGVGNHWWYQLTAADFHACQLPDPAGGSRSRRLGEPPARRGGLQPRNATDTKNCACGSSWPAPSLTMTGQVGFVRTGRPLRSGVARGAVATRLT